MSVWMRVAVAIALCAGLAACGGGGGGGGGGESAPPPLTATVSVNGSTATPGTDGQYAVKPGDAVEIVPSQAADWTGSGSDPAVTLRSATTTPTRWTARILNAKPQTLTYTASAKASANASLTRDIVLKIAPGDARNGEYRVYATSGLQLKLRLDFDIHAYDMISGDGTTLSDEFSAVADEPGTFAFKSSRLWMVTDIVRFRVVPDAVIGTFPFDDAFVVGPTPIRPFIAVRKLVTQQADLAGVYNRVGVQHYRNSPSRSSILQMQVPAGGRQLLMCNSLAIYSIANCTGNIVTYTVTASDEAGVWNIVNVANANDGGRMVIADVGGSHIYLSAGKPAAQPDTAVWRIGVADAPDWNAAIAYGGSTVPDWGKITMTQNDYVRAILRPDGPAGSATSAVNTNGPNGPAGLRAITPQGDSNIYFGVRNSKVFAVVGASNDTTGGYVMISAFE